MYIADLKNAIMPESLVTSIQVSPNFGRSSAALGGLETRLPRDLTEVQEGQLLCYIDDDTKKMKAPLDIIVTELQALAEANPKSSKRTLSKKFTRSPVLQMTACVKREAVMPGFSKDDPNSALEPSRWNSSR